MHTCKISCLLFCLLLPPAVFGDRSLPTPILEYEASYTLYWHGIRVGTSTHTIQKKDNQITEANAVTKPILSILPFFSKEHSRFFLTNQQATPLQFEYQTHEKKKKQSGKILFNWPQKTINNVKDEHPPVISSLPAQAQDKISVYFQLRQDLRQEKYPLKYTVIEPDHVKTYLFSIVGHETLNTALGEYDTVILEHLSENKERLTTLWLAKDLDYVVVKLQQKINGKKVGYSTLKTLNVTS